MERSTILKISMSNALIYLLKMTIRNILDYIVEAYLSTVRLVILLLAFVVGEFSSSGKSFSSIVQISSIEFRSSSSVKFNASTRSNKTLPNSLFH